MPTGCSAKSPGVTADSFSLKPFRSRRQQSALGEVEQGTSELLILSGKLAIGLQLCVLIVSMGRPFVGLLSLPVGMDGDGERFTLR